MISSTPINNFTCLTCKKQGGSANDEVFGLCYASDHNVVNDNLQQHYQCTYDDIVGISYYDPIFKDCKENLHEIIKFAGVPKLDINSRRDNLKITIETNFPHLFDNVEAGLSVGALLKIENLTQPCTLIYLGNPSTRKSTTLKIISTIPEAYCTDEFTPRSFVSHSAIIKKEDLVKIDMLPQIRHKVLITPELAPLFKARAEVATELFSILTRVLDGHGYYKNSGVHGRRGYSGDYCFHWLGAVVEIPHSVWKLLGSLGPRMLFWRIEDQVEDKEERILRQLKDDTAYNQKIKLCQQAVESFWSSLPEKVIWDKTKDDQNVLKRIAKLSIQLSALRAEIPLWFDKEGNVNYESPIKEDPERVSKYLYNIACGHAILYGRNFVTFDDLDIVQKIALDSAPQERVKIFKALLNEVRLDTARIREITGLSKPTAINEMGKLEKVGLVDKIEVENGFEISLKPEFRTDEQLTLEVSNC